MTIGTRRMTLEQFLALPEEKPALEFIDGEVIQKVPPMTRHGLLQGAYYRQIWSYVHPRRLAHVIPEHRSTYGGLSTVPDVAVYLWGRIPRDAAGELVDQVTVPPDIAVEILSPGQSLRKTIERCHWYIDNGVRISLLTDPRDSTIRDFRLGTEPRILRRGDTLDLGDVLPGFTLDVGSLFDALTEG